MATTTRKQLDKLIEAAQNAIEFTVDGKGEFPYDMLRYDLCWPASEGDSLGLHATYGIPRIINLKGLKPPTVRRWASFGWTVLS
jgi:hypothetical protein